MLQLYSLSVCETARYALNLWISQFAFFLSSIDNTLTHSTLQQNKAVWKWENISHAYIRTRHELSAAQHSAVCLYSSCMARKQS